jgi:hypothetical protein
MKVQFEEMEKVTLGRHFDRRAGGRLSLLRNRGDFGSPIALPADLFAMDSMEFPQGMDTAAPCTSGSGN